MVWEEVGVWEGRGGIELVCSSAKLSPTLPKCSGEEEEPGEGSTLQCILQCTLL